MKAGGRPILQPVFWFLTGPQSRVVDQVLCWVSWTGAPRGWPVLLGPFGMTLASTPEFMVPAVESGHRFLYPLWQYINPLQVHRFTLYFSVLPSEQVGRSGSWICHEQARRYWSCYVKPTCLDTSLLFRYSDEHGIFLRGMKFSQTIP